MRQVRATLLRGAGATLHRGTRASHYRGPSHCGAQTPDAQAQQLWLMGPVAPRHVGSSQTRARTRVPCISRQILNHCATREALPFGFDPLLIQPNFTYHQPTLVYCFISLIFVLPFLLDLHTNYGFPDLIFGIPQSFWFRDFLFSSLAATDRHSHPNFIL